MNDRILKNPFVKRKVAAIALCVVTAGGLASCGDCEGFLRKCSKIDQDLLRGTRWKLEYVYFGDIDSVGRRTILEPKDCDTCYTLTFDAKEKYKITGVSILNTVSIQFQHFGRPKMDILITDLDEPHDGNLYTSLIRSVGGIGGEVGSGLTVFVYNDPPGINIWTHYLRFRPINP